MNRAQFIAAESHGRFSGSAWIERAKGVSGKALAVIKVVIIRAPLFLDWATMDRSERKWCAAKPLA